MSFLGALGYSDLVLRIGGFDRLVESMERDPLSACRVRREDPHGEHWVSSYFMSHPWVFQYPVGWVSGMASEPLLAIINTSSEPPFSVLP